MIPFERTPYFDGLSSPFESPLSMVVEWKMDILLIDSVGVQVHNMQPTGLWKNGK